MAAHYYEILDHVEAVEGGHVTHVRATEHTSGPWEEGLQHAGPPAALLTRAVGLLPGGPPQPVPSRLGFDILAPIPVADLVVTARMARSGRRVALAEATLAAADRPDRALMTLRAWLLRWRADDGLVPAAAAGPAPDLPAGAHPMPPPPGWRPGYLDSVEWTWTDGSFESPGPATVWTRLLVDLVQGESVSALEHLVAIADSASGISAVASPTALLFVNTDLTLHLTRLPESPKTVAAGGAQIWLRAHTHLSGGGIGRTIGDLGDAAGVVAHSAQCLFVEPQPT